MRVANQQNVQVPPPPHGGAQFTCNMDVLLAAVEALRNAEMKEYHTRAGKIQKVHVKRKRGIFKCDKCPSVFGLRHNLLRHDRTIHQGRRPFKCDQPGCTASFVQRFDLETHRSSVHDKRKDHPCPQCDRSFSQRSNLHTHMKITHQPHTLEVLRCNKCDKTFKTKSNLKQHTFGHLMATKEARAQFSSSTTNNNNTSPPTSPSNSTTSSQLETVSHEQHLLHLAQGVVQEESTSPITSSQESI